MQNLAPENADLFKIYKKKEFKDRFGHFWTFLKGQF
jgi:hypothetical protein